jgi:two-component system, chemotaxis family, sensor kinase CheA
MDFKPDDGFFKELLGIFKLETQEHIQSMRTGIGELERHQGTDKQLEVAEGVHRAAHSLKGAARTIGLADVEPICQSLETFFGILKRQKISMPPDLVGMLNRSVQNLETLLSTLNAEGKVTGDKSEITRLIEEIQYKISVLAK